MDVYFAADDQPSTSLSPEDDDYDPCRPIERAIEFLREMGFLAPGDHDAVNEVVANLKASAN